MKKETAIIAVLLILFGFLADLTNPFGAADRYVMDSLYQSGYRAGHNIRLIAIDEKTLDAYGTFSSWSREKSAELISLLNKEESGRPAVIGFDVMFISESDSRTDTLLADACAPYDNIVSAVNIVNESVLEEDPDTGKLKENTLHISLVEKPYEALLSQTSIGFANTLPDDDSYIRRSILYRMYGEERIESLSFCIYRLWCEKNNIAVNTPNPGSYNEFSFSYAGKPGAYETVSLVDVLDGRVDPKTFRNCIVLVGAYAPGMQDAYHTPIDRSSQMYGVEIHANIIDALQNGRTYSVFSPIWLSLLVGLLAALYYLLLGKLRVIWGGIVGILGIVCEFMIGKLLLRAGYELPLLTLPILLLLIYAGRLIAGYLEEWRQRRRVVDAFKKYVAPQVVEKLAKKENFEISLDGENRDIAVLFIDIRGFTTMSEALAPEEVVGILNEYLSIVTASIFQYGGTLDKFIGDAAMAVFNAPFDLDDYIFRAVCTAREIVANTAELDERLQRMYGRSIRFGIGIHAGPAVVGNIGCKFRMDYTAIGDTVNTAARLEANAGPGQILISDTVRESLKERIRSTRIGEIPLKGKTIGITVWQLDEVYDVQNTRH